MAESTGSILVTGPSRSGKSEWAEHLALSSGCPITYIATAAKDPNDSEWQARLQRHRDRRPNHWQTLEVPKDLAIALKEIPPQNRILLDSLGTWVANCLELKDQDWLGQQKQLIDALVAVGSRAIVVAEETGWGVVPAYPLGRQFRDRLGTLTRTVALHSSQVFLVVAGYAVDIKQHGREVPDLGQNLGQTFEGGKGQSVKKVK
ncbi:MAG: bifunctional adenosylcobinamide kinase/adenosylcobinamide-phosphate guanylyltransferase [Cyanobacteria bacterium P01_C01_bin.89]